MLGENALRPYAGYRDDVDPGIANEFSTAAYRFGHSLLADDVEFFDNDGNPIRDEIPLSEAFFNPEIVIETGIDPIIKDLATETGVRCQRRAFSPIVHGIAAEMLAVGIAINGDCSPLALALEPSSVGDD